MLKSLSRTVMVTGTRSNCSVAWTLFPASPNPDCSAWWQACHRSWRRGLGSRDVPDLTAGSGAGVSMLWVQTLEWHIQDQNSRKTSITVSSRATKIGGGWWSDLCYAFYIFPWQQPPTMFLTPLVTSIFLIHYSQYLSFCLRFPWLAGQ